MSENKPNLKVKSYQEYFDIALEGLRKQAGPSLHITFGGCSFRGAKEHRCAVGFLIPDEDYKEGMEFLSIYNAEAFSNIFGVDQNLRMFLGDMQKYMHDLHSSHNGKDFLERMEKGASTVAAIYKLKYSPPKE